MLALLSEFGEETKEHLGGVTVTAEKGPLLLPDPGGGRCVCEGAYQSE